jgi:hypothetical protein
MGQELRSTLKRLAKQTQQLYCRAQTESQSWGKSVLFSLALARPPYIPTGLSIQSFPVLSRAFYTFLLLSGIFGLSSSSKTKPAFARRYIYQPQTQVYMQIHRPSSYTCVARYSRQTL